MSKLLKELEPGPNEDGLKKLREESQGLDRSSRKARVSSAGHPSSQASPSTPPQRDQRSYQSGTRGNNSLRDGVSAGKTTFGDSQPPSTSSSPLAETPESKKIRIKLKVPLSSREQSLQGSPAANRSAAGSQHPEGSPSMASQRNRPGRGGPRGTTNDLTEEKDLWQQILPHLAALNKAETRAAEVNKEIFENEVQKKEKANAGIKPSIDGIEHLSTLYREQIKTADEQKARATDEDLLSKIQVLMGMVKHNEESMDTQPPARGGSSRNSTMDFDGPSDSPIPSPAENKQVRKIGPSRTSSLPPRSSTDVRPDTAPSEASERSSKPKIVYAQGEEVAFKRKIPGKTEEQDWILGKVMRVIGEGKSRRYEVQDPFPDEGSVNPLYKSSASQMVPIPAEGTELEDYEVGKRVLALYPDTTTFYRAEVKSMLDDGARVQLLFEDEAAGALKVVERRLVLDHKG